MFICVHDVQALVVLGGWRAGVGGSTPFVVKYKPKGLSQRCYGKNISVGVRSCGADWERPTVIPKITPLLFPFKVDQFKSDIKIRNNQVKKNTAKGYSIYIQ